MISRERALLMLITFKNRMIRAVVTAFTMMKTDIGSRNIDVLRNYVVPLFSL